MFQFSILLNICIIWTDIHQITDVSAALSNCITLEKFSDLIKQHNGNALFVVTEKNRSHGCHCHQKVLIKYLPVHDTLSCFFQDIIPDHQIRDHKEPELYISFDRKQGKNNDQNSRYNDTNQHFFLLLIHNKASLT